MRRLLGKSPLICLLAFFFLLGAAGEAKGALSAPTALKISDYPGVLITDRATKITLQYQQEEGAENLKELYFWVDDQSPVTNRTWFSAHGLIKRLDDGTYRYYGTQYRADWGKTCPDSSTGPSCYLNYDWGIGGFLKGATDKIYFTSNQTDPSDLLAPGDTTTGFWKLLNATPSGKILTLEIELALSSSFANRNLNFYLGAINSEGTRTPGLWVRQSDSVNVYESIPIAVESGPDVPLYGKLELSFPGLLTANPYDPDIVDIWADITSPTGKTYRQNAFAYTNFMRQAVSVPSPDYCNMSLLHKGKNDYYWYPSSSWNTMESLVQGDREWRLRFSPDEVGDWTYQLKMKDSSGEITLPTGSFRVSDTDLPGPIRVSPQDKNYLEDARGNFFYGIGTNNNVLSSIAFGDPANTRWCRGTYIFEEQLEELKSNKMNVLRLGPGNGWGFSFEWGKGGLGNYDNRQKQAWALDHVIDFAKERNIYVIPVFEWQGFFQDWTPAPKPTGIYNEWPWNPYNEVNGGPLPQNSSPAFWTDAKAQKYYQWKLRYLSARYFYNRNILFYEFWNETQVKTDWLRKMYDYLNDQDVTPLPHKRLLTLSYHGLYDTLGSTVKGNFSIVDVANWHWYGCRTIYGHEGTEPDAGCEAGQTGVMTLYDKLTKFSRDYFDGGNKPIGLTEIGLLANEAAGSDYAWNCKYDSNCNISGKCCYQVDELRQAVWTTLMAKGAAVAPFYWWLPHNNLIDPTLKQGYNYQFYKTMADFLEGEDLRNTERFKPATYSPNNKLLSLGLRKGSEKLMIWTLNTDSDWVEMIRKKASPLGIADVSCGVLEIPDLSGGTYHLQIFNTSTGASLEDRQITAGNKGLLLRLPTFSKDIAAKLTFVSAGVAAASEAGVASAANAQWIPVGIGYNNPQKNCPTACAAQGMKCSTACQSPASSACNTPIACSYRINSVACPLQSYVCADPNWGACQTWSTRLGNGNCCCEPIGPTPALPFSPLERCRVQVLGGTKHNANDCLVVKVSQNPLYANEPSCYQSPMEINARNLISGQPTSQPVCTTTGFGPENRTQFCVWNTAGKSQSAYWLSSDYAGHGDGCLSGQPCCDKRFTCSALVGLGQLPGDLNNDGQVNGADAKIMLSRYGTTDQEADLNKDGVVDGADFAELRALL